MKKKLPNLIMTLVLLFCVRGQVKAFEDGQTVRLVNQGKVLTIQDSKLAASAPAVSWTETNTNSQRWEISSNARGMVFGNAYTGLYLGGLSNISAKVKIGQIERTQTATRGTWVLEPVEGKEDTYIIFNGTTKRYALAANLNPTDGDAITLQSPLNIEDSARICWTVEVCEPIDKQLTPALRDDMMEKWKDHYYHKAGTGHVIGNGGWWGDAEMFEVVIDALETTGDEQYAVMFDELYKNFCARNNTDWSGNEFNDDITWMCIACIRAYLLTGNVEYRNRAKQNFDKMYARANIYGDGTLVWKQGNKGTTSCINGPASVCASYLGIALGQESYHEIAKRIYTGQRALLYNINSQGVFNGHVYDSGDSEKGEVGNTWGSTYNQGTSLGAALMLYEHYGDPLYKSDADAIMNWTIKNLANSDKLIHVCQTTSGDLTGFKGILLRYVRRYAAELNHPEYYDWLAKNAYHAWNNRNSKGISSSAWLSKTREDFTFGNENFMNDGVGAFTALSAAFNAHLGVQDTHDAFSRTQVEHFNFLRGAYVAEISGEEGNKAAGPMLPKDYIGFRNVDFGNKVASHIRMRVQNQRALGSLNVYMDSPDEKGVLLATIERKDLTNVRKWEEVTVPLNIPVGGRHDIYLLTESPVKSETMSVNWFEFLSEYALYADITNNGGTVSASMSASQHELKALTDDNALTGFTGQTVSGTSCWLAYTSPTPVLPQGYSLSAAVQSQADPVSWTFQASNDGRNWEDLDSQSDTTFQVRGQKLDFDLKATQTYTHFRLMVTARKEEGSLALGEWQILGQQVAATDITAGGGVLTEGFEALTDHNAATATDLSLPAELIYDAGANYVLTGYSLTAVDKTQAPTAWTLYGSTDGTRWVEIDARSEERSPYDGATNVYALTRVPAYSHFRLVFEGTEGETAEVAELQLFGTLDFGSLYADITGHSVIEASDKSETQALCDKDGATVAAVSGEEMTWEIKMPVASRIMGYSLLSGDHPEMNPYEVSVIGIQAGTDTVILSNKTLNFKDVHARVSATISSSKLFDSMCLKVRSTQGGGNRTELAELEVYTTSIAGQGTETCPTVSGITLDGDEENAEVNKLNDGDRATLFQTAFDGPVSLIIRYDQPQHIDTYTLTAAKDQASFDPAAWKLEGSADGETWTLLDSRIGETFSQRYATQFYSSSNDNAYTHYRLTVEDVNGGAKLQIGEWQLLKLHATSSISTNRDDRMATLSVTDRTAHIHTLHDGVLSVYDLTGVMQLAEPVTEGDNAVSLDKLPKGTYVLMLNAKGKQQMKKIFLGR